MFFFFPFISQLFNITEKAKLYRDSKKNQQFPGVRREEGRNRWNIADFEGSETTLCDTMMVNTCHYTFVQNHKMYNTKSEP